MGGAFVAARSRIGVGWCPGCDKAEVVPGRLAAVHLATLAKGGVVGYSVYLYPSEGMTERNREILDKLGQHAAAHGKVWVAGGTGTWTPSHCAPQGGLKN